MTLALEHRGPDESGHFLDSGIALGVRRLRVIDLTGSRQPLANEDDTIHAAFNGEIYNYRRLRRDLQRSGHRLPTQGDGETLVHLYEDHDLDFARFLSGMFAIALWDGPRRRLVLARDRLGIKPLYYALVPEGLAFASEIKSLLAGGLITASLDLEAAELFLALGYVPGPRTLFAGVRKLPAATVLEWRDGRLTGPVSYWCPLDPPAVPSRSWQEDQDQLLDLLRSAVRAHTISDVPLGLLLSGGLDSSLVAALAAEATHAPIETFSIGFADDTQTNELGWARQTARRLGARHHEIEMTVSTHGDLLDEGLWHLEEPIADLSFIGLLLLSRMAREHVTVALCGQAADELLAGYAKHRAARLADLAVGQPEAVRRSMARAARAFDCRSRPHRLLHTIASVDDAERFLAMARVVTPPLRDQLAGPRLRASDPSALLRDIAQPARGHDRSSFLQRTLLCDLGAALPDLIFLYSDKMSMAASLEVRVPFADPDVVTFCMALPPARLFRVLRGKEILRRISRDLVDESIITRPKRGFLRAASTSWLAHHSDDVRATMLDQRCAGRGLFDPAAVTAWLNQRWPSGRGGDALLVAYLLERWHRVFVDTDGIAHDRARAARDVAKSMQAPEPVRVRSVNGSRS